MKLVTEAGAETRPGAMLHMTTGPSIGQAWRFERIATKHDGDHHVHVSRCHPKLGRVHKEYHPRLFGCAVVIDVKIYADRQKLMAWARNVLTQTVLLTVGGFIAWGCAEICMYFAHGA